VYAAAGFHRDYIPNPPSKITNIASTDLAACNTATNCNQDVCIIPTNQTQGKIAYNFSLATSPQNPNFPTSYTLGFDMTGLTLSTSDQANLKIATCNADTGEWELYDATYGRCSWLGNKFCASAAVSHFTPYAVVIDNRPDPLPAPSNFTVGCSDSKAILSWSKIQNTNNTGYKVYTCSAESCSTVKETINDTNTLSVEYTVPNGTEACYAVSGVSSSAIQEATRSSIKCTTPDATKCAASGITLLTPDNNEITTETPTFRWLGSGDSQFYILTVRDKDSQVIMTAEEPGEVTDADDEATTRMQYSVASSASLTQGEKYTWDIKGYKTNGTEITSQQFVFTYMGGSEACVETLDVPTLITPTNGSQVTSKTPTFMWAKVDNATSYILSILDDSGKLIYETVATSLSVAFPSSGTSGSTLLDNKQYSWHVRAASECAVSNESQDYFFTKVSGTTAVLPAPQWVNQSEDNKDAIVGGDQYVILQWRQINESNLYGYNIYRSTTPSPKPTSPIETVLLDQLDAPPSNPSCPTFSVTSPGFCDVSVTNGTQYYYWIAAIDDGGSVSSTSVYQSVLLNLQRPVLIAPGSVVGEVVTTATPLMLWLPVNGNSVKYIVSVTDTSTNSIIMQSDVSSTSTTYNGQTLKDQGVYTWNVKAYNSLVTSEPSQTYKFTKGESSSKPDPPEWCQGLAVNCTGNPGGPPYGYNTQLSNDTIKVYWERITSASNIAGYYLYRSTSAADVFNAEPIFVPDYDCEKTGQACYSQARMQRGEIYYYALTTLDTGGQESDFSQVLEVRYDLRSPVVLYPASDQIVYEAQPTFQWMHVNGATQYKVQVDRTGNFSSSDLMWNALLPASSSGGVSSVSYGDTTYGVPKGPLENPFDPDSPGTTYYWRVCPLNDITTSDSACTNGYRFFKNLKPPTQKSPVSGESISTEDITFQWTSTPGAANYQIRICEGGGNCDDFNIIYYNSDVDGDETSVTVTSSEVEFESCDTSVDPNCTSMGVYSWQVRAVDSEGHVSGRWDKVPTQSFVKVGQPAPNLIAPYNGAILQPDEASPLCRDMYNNLTYSYSIYFNWEEIANSGGYNIRVIDIKATQDAGQPVIVYDGEVSQGTLQVGTCSGDGAIPLAAGREYEWNVATANGSYFDPTNARRFVTGLPAPNSRAPEDGKQVILSQDCDGASSKMCVHFEWNGGTFTDGAGNTVTLPGVIGASSYDIEIINQQQVVYHCERAYAVPADPPAQSFKNLVTTFCDLSSEDVFNNDTFTWRVRARDSSNVLTATGYGYPSAWSQNRQFTVLIPGPILASPPPQGDTCYQDPSIDAVESECTTMSCQNPQFFWSPIPLSTDACYRIEVSDTADFRNLLRVANSVDNAADFVCEAGVGCNSYKAPISSPIPMTNGVVYYWRIGASVPPDAAAPCGTTWIYSDTRAFIKRPNGGLGLSYSAVTHQGASFSWGQPKNCQNDASEPKSVPSVPPNGGEFLTYLEQGSAIPTSFGPPYRHVPSTQYSLDIAEGLSEQTDYIFCVAVVDDSFYFTDGGHHGVRECVLFHTAAAPEEGG
jgi:hypothetical protein